MNNILCRGIREDNGCWIYGTVIFPRGLDGKVYTAIIPLIDGESFYSEIRSVRPDSVGWFTGLFDATTWEELTPEEKKTYKEKDWKGRLIFEGDILGANYDSYFPDFVTRTVVVWSDGVPEGEPIGWRMKQGDYIPDTLCIGDEKMNRVIGNIHQNPELLKGEWE